MQNNNQEKPCKCSGSKKIDSNAIRLEESTVELMKVESEDGSLHYCFDGIELSVDEILKNLKIGITLLDNKDKLIVSSINSILDKTEDSNYLFQECILEDGNYYTIITKNI